MGRNTIFGAVLMAMVASACGNFTANPEEDIDDTALHPLTYQAALSDCGGLDVTVEISEYCNAEILSWDYDPATKVFVFSDNRILLNCCGEHDMSIELEDGVYTITEYDSPLIIPGQEESRCNCMCSFDYEIEVQNMPAEEIQVRLLRDVSDSDQWNNTLVWEGTLDLTDESGDIVIDDEPIHYGCEF